MCVCVCIYIVCTVVYITGKNPQCRFWECFCIYSIFSSDHTSTGCRKCITDTEREEHPSFCTEIWVSWSWNNGLGNCQESAKLWPFSHCVEQVTWQGRTDSCHILFAFVLLAACFWPDFCIQFLLIQFWHVCFVPNNVAYSPVVVVFRYIQLCWVAILPDS